MNKCLVIIDLQNDYFPGGKMELAGIEAAVENAGILLAEFRKKKLPVIHVQHICGAMSHMCIDATTRAAFDLGFNCVVAEDACATRDLLFNNKIIKASDVHASFMAALSFPYAKVVSTKDVVKDLDIN